VIVGIFLLTLFDMFTLIFNESHNMLKLKISLFIPFPDLSRMAAHEG
jgi:hypothetical protein